MEYIWNLEVAVWLEDIFDVTNLAEFEALICIILYPLILGCVDMSYVVGL
jgi:hypothetical protein